MVVSTLLLNRVRVFAIFVSFEQRNMAVKKLVPSQWICKLFLTYSKSNQPPKRRFSDNIHLFVWRDRPGEEQRHKYHHLTTTLHLTLKMTTAQVVETSVTTNSLSKDYPHPDDQAKQITDTHEFKPFTNINLFLWRIYHHIGEFYMVAISLLHWEIGFPEKRISHTLARTPRPQVTILNIIARVPVALLFYHQILRRSRGRDRGQCRSGFSPMLVPPRRRKSFLQSSTRTCWRSVYSSGERLGWP